MYTLVHSLSVLRRKPGDGDEDDCSRRWAKPGQRASWLHLGASGETFGLPDVRRVAGARRGSTKNNTSLTKPGEERGDEGMLRALFAWRWSAGSCPSNTNPCEDITEKNTGIDDCKDRIYFSMPGL